MPITVHFGNPRQGKSYAAVADHIVPALAKGRRVVTNIEGMGDPARREKLNALLLERFKYEGEVDLHFVPHSELEKGNIFPRDTKSEDADGTRIYDDSQSIVQFGTLIVWDEAKLFTTDGLIKAWHDALTYHGHWARGGFTVDIVIIHQNWKSLAPIVRATTERVCEFVKQASGKGYRRWTFMSPGDRDLYRRAGDTLQETFSYDPAIFALYKTNADDGPTNDNIALPFWKTQYFKKRIRLFALLIVGGFACSGWAIWHLYSSVQGQVVKSDKPTAGGALASNVPAKSAVPLEPEIVGQVPTSRGRIALVRDGSNFVTVAPGFGGLVKYKGVSLKWPEDF
jgi:zona occludens toxin